MRDENEMGKGKNVIAGVILSIFEQEGPTPKVCIPELPLPNQVLIAMKSISLLMGEQIYQEGKHFDQIRYFGILPFPDLKITALTYFFLIHDEKARGKAKASTISILVKERYSSFLYENMKQLSLFLSDASLTMVNNPPDKEKEKIIFFLYEKLKNYTQSIQAPLAEYRKIKVIFTGLDASGKTSFLKAIKQKYSELTNVLPTKGINREGEYILGQELIEWDIGGQEKYRNIFLRQSQVYLYDTNLLFFMIDIRDPSRFDDAIDFLDDILRSFRALNQFPPIIINFHKMDPDMVRDQFIKKQISILKDKINLLSAGDFKILFYETSIFNQYSLLKSFSAGITAISPNRKIFKRQLEWLAHKVHAKTVLLLDKHSIILGDYAENELSGKVSEISAPHFQNLFRTFSDFKLLKHKFAEWTMQQEKILYYSIEINKQQLYLLVLARNLPSTNYKMERYLNEFIERIEPLINSFL